MATFTVTTHANYLEDIWTRGVSMALENNLVLGRRVLRLDGEARKGNVLNYPRLANIGAVAVTAGGVFTPTANTEANVAITIDRHFITSIEVDDIVALQSKYDSFAMYSGKLGYGLALQFETDLAGLYSGLGQQVGTAGVPVNDDPLLNCIQLIDQADSPGEDRTADFRPASKRALMKIDKFVDAAKMGLNGKSPATTGLFGEIYGIPIFFSNTIVDSAGVHNLIFWKEAFVAAKQKDVSVEDFGRTGLKVTKTLAAQAVWGYSENRDTSAVDFVS